MKTNESKNTILGCSYARAGVTKFLVGLVWLGLAGCNGIDQGVLAGPDTEDNEAVQRAPQDDNGGAPQVTEPDPEPEVTCEDTHTCPRDTMSAISVFEDESTWSFSFPSDLQDENAWLNQRLFRLPVNEGPGYDLSSITAIRVSYGNYIMVKSPHGDRVLSFANFGPYWAGSNDYHSGQGNWLTLENARWTGTHTASLDLCVNRTSACRVISIEVAQ